MGYSAPAKQAFRLHGLSRIVEVVEVSCCALGAKALRAEKLGLI